MPNISAKNPTQKRKSYASRTLSSRLQAYLLAHAHALFSSLGRQLRSPFTWLMTTLVMAIALALSGSFFALVKNAQQLTSNIDASNQVSVFLQQDVSESKARSLVKRLAGHHLIQSVKFISPDQALEEFKQYSGFADALNALDENPLPAVIQVLPIVEINDAVAMTELLAELEKHQQVDFAQADMQWLQRLQSLMQLARRGVELFSFLIGAAVLFITGNTIRLELHNRKEEVLIAKLVGASDSFIQRPFLYSGFWYGFFAGIMAWMLVTIMLLLLQSPVTQLASFYSGEFSLLFLSAYESLMLVLMASALGVLGAWSVLKFQLHEVKPE